MKIPRKLIKASKSENRSLVARGLKLNEEAGELAAEILKYKGMKSTKGKTKKEVLYDLHLEAVDCLIMAFDVLVATGATNKRIDCIMNSQLDKWMNYKKK